MNTPTMVFHAPYPVQESGTGSAARPPRMLQAFRDIGYEVLDITGHGAERAHRVRALRHRIAEGQRIDFAYGESSTMPSLLTETHHLPTHPLVDLDLLRLLHRSGIPTGLFYRDVYWRFPAYDASVPRLVGYGTKTLYHLELLAMRPLLDRVYLPSEPMAEYVPHLDISRARALPPGGVITDAPQAGTEAGGNGGDGTGGSRGELTLLYIGNISDYYRMHALIEAVTAVPGVRMILCTTPGAWEAARSTYAPLMDASIEVVHARGRELEPLFARADVCSLVVEPAEYRDFAAPIKLYEYLGHGKPVLASAGTLAATTLEAEGFGWSTPYTAADIAEHLSVLRDDPGEVRRVAAQVRAGRSRHTWAARAREVAEDLGSLRQ